MTAKKKRPPVTIDSAQIWSHHHDRMTPASLTADGFSKVVHRIPEKRVYDREPWVRVKLKPDPSFDINIATTLVEARRLRDELIKAIAEAETDKPCEAGCYHCDKGTP